MRVVLETTGTKKERLAYAVNSNQFEVMGAPFYPSVTDIPSLVELAIIVAPATIVP